MTTKIVEKAFAKLRNEALEELAETALRAVSHVGYANYPEREAEAKRWIRDKLATLSVFRT